MILERLPEVLKLSRAEQLELFAELGDLLAQDDAWDSLTPEVVAELNRKLDEFRANPASGRTWDEVKTRAAAGEWRR